MTFARREFFARDTVTVARELIGCQLHRHLDGTEVVATIVEVEAYLGQMDPASHAYRGPTERNRVMFREAGHLYVYLSYGLHYCANIVTETEGVAGAVLLRSAFVESGVDEVKRRRARLARDEHLLRGPGNLGKGLAFSRGDNEADLCEPDSGLRISLPRPGAVFTVATGPRIGISKAVSEPLRYWWKGHLAVSGRG